MPISPTSRHRLALAGVLCTLLGACTARAPETAARAEPARFALCDNYCALVDQHGALVTHRLFEGIKPFEGALAVIKHDGNEGAIDRQGRTVLEPIYARVDIKDGGQFLIARQAPAADGGEPTHIVFNAQGDAVVKRAGGPGVGVWQGRPFYWTCPPGSSGPGASDNACGAVFVDARGQPIASFKRFIPANGGVPAQASSDGTHFGLIGDDLKFVSAATYTSMSALAGKLIEVSDGTGVGAIDPHGHVVVPIGRYEDLFMARGDLFLVAFGQGDPKCGHYLRPDGQPVELPAGVCAGLPIQGSAKAGYALISNGRGLGAINAQGEVIIPMDYMALGQINSRLIGFASPGTEPGSARVGVMDLKARVVLKPEYRDAEAGPGNTIAVRTATGWGLVSDEGKPLTAADFTQIQPLGDTLAAAKVAKSAAAPSHYVFLDGAGQPLAITSLHAPEPVWGAAGRAWKIYGPQPGTPYSLVGLIASDGRLLVPVQYSAADFVDLGGDLWGVSTTASNTPDVIAVYGAGARPVEALKPYHDIQPFTDGVTTARTHDDDAVLIDTAGQVLASFNALFPLYGTAADNADPRVEQILNRCFSSDPTVAPKNVSQATKMICAQPKLAALSRATELVYHGALSGNCLPDVFETLRPAYDQALAACTTDGCLEAAMHHFQDAVKATSCAPAHGWKKSDAPVDAATQASIKAFLSRTDKDFAEFTADATAGSAGDASADSDNDTVWFTHVTLGNLPVIYVGISTYAPNEPFWLVTRGPDTTWRLLLSDVSSAGPDPVGGLHDGLPILRVQQKVSAGEQGVTYYEYNGTRYVTRNGCSILFAGDGDDAKPVADCG